MDVGYSSVTKWQLNSSRSSGPIQRNQQNHSLFRLNDLRPILLDKTSRMIEALSNDLVLAALGDLEAGTRAWSRQHPTNVVFRVPHQSTQALSSWDLSFFCIGP
jgi:hypothetical protein